MKRILLGKAEKNKSCMVILEARVTTLSTGSLLMENTDLIQENKTMAKTLMNVFHPYLPVKAQLMFQIQSHHNTLKQLNLNAVDFSLWSD